MTKQLSNITTQKVDATERTNTVDELSPILEFQPNDGIALKIRGMVNAGSEPGIPIYADLQDTDGNDLPVDTAVALEYERPSWDKARTVSHVRDNIRPYNSLSVSEQQNMEHVDQTKHTLKNTDEALANGETPQLHIRDVDKLYVSVDSSEQIDWDNSRLYIDGNAVRTVS